MSKTTVNEFHVFLSDAGFSDLSQGRYEKTIGKNTIIVVLVTRKKNTDVKVGHLYNRKYVSGFKAAKISLEEFKQAYLDFMQEISLN